MPWFAVYYKPLNAIAVRALDERCGTTREITEDETSIRIHLTEVDHPGAGACPKPYSVFTVDLQAPVGTRPIVSADPGTNGVAIDLAQRLHFPIKTKQDLPFGVHGDGTSGGGALTVFYATTATHPAVKLTSTRDTSSHRSGSTTIRTTKDIENCPEVVCWVEGGYLYGIDSLTPDSPPLSRSAAVAAAAALTLT